MLSLVVIRSRDMEKLVSFYGALDFTFIRHRHGTGPEHFSCMMGGAVFEIYPAIKPEDSTTATWLGFTVPSLSQAVDWLRGIQAVVLVEPMDSPFARRAVVKDFKAHEVELYELGGGLNASQT